MIDALNLHSRIGVQSIQVLLRPYALGFEKRPNGIHESTRRATVCTSKAFILVPISDRYLVRNWGDCVEGPRLMNNVRNYVRDMEKAARRESLIHEVIESAEVRCNCARIGCCLRTCGMERGKARKLSKDKEAPWTEDAARLVYQCGVVGNLLHRECSVSFPASRHGKYPYSHRAISKMHKINCPFLKSGRLAHVMNFKRHIFRRVFRSNGN